MLNILFFFLFMPLLLRFMQCVCALLKKKHTASHHKKKVTVELREDEIDTPTLRIRQCKDIIEEKTSSQTVEYTFCCSEEKKSERVFREFRRDYRKTGDDENVDSRNRTVQKVPRKGSQSKR